MVRYRHVKKPPLQSDFRSEENVGASKKNEIKCFTKNFFRQFLWIGTGFLLIGLVAYLVHLGNYDRVVNAPFEAPKVTKTLEPGSPGLWGSYRPGTYFGLRTRAPRDLLVGLMWTGSKGNIRHWCEQSDGLESYGWLQHDGENFGIQEIRDETIVLNTSFVKRGKEWTARIKALPKYSEVKDQYAYLFFYAGLESGTSETERLAFDYDKKTIVGSTYHLEEFELSFSEKADVAVQKFASSIETPGPHKYTESVAQSLRSFNRITEGFEQEIPLEARPDKPDLVVYLVVSKLPVELEVSFKSRSVVNREDDLMGENYSRHLNHWRNEFLKKFENTFHLHEKGFDEKAIRFAQATLSNLIGGIGYFYGHSLVQSERSKGPVKYWDAPLLTAVPSRSFFPRGFLWDEGFHNLLISKWSSNLSLEILGHWMDLINTEGWIPREQILGSEARAKVPDEFVVQRNRNANPPTLLLTLDSIIRDKNNVFSDDFRFYLDKMWPRLEKWYDWFHRTQRGETLGTYRWRGRNDTAIHELNPKTLTSGLDDFPRASHPTNEERHVDLRCWMALASTLMVNIAKLIGKKPSEIVQYVETAKLLTDNSVLNQAHWSDKIGAYADYGFHTEGVSLKRPPVKRQSHSPHHAHETPQKVRVVTKEPTYQFVNQVGYVSLFPFLLRLLNFDSPKLKKILEDLENPNIFYTDYGLRSLSKSSSLYMKRNTEHDPPYWRGPIWINMNYLAVRALHHYGYVNQGPYSSDAQRIYQKLRQNLMDNLIKEYYRTGYVWEQYDDTTGMGQGCRPFTGWSSLVVLIMGENY